MAKAKDPQPTRKRAKPRRRAAKASPAADRAVKAAKAAGARGRRLTAAKQALRDSLIVARAAQDWPVQAIAAEVDLSVEQVRRVLRGKRGVRSPLEETPMQLLEDLARGFKLSVGDLEAMAAAWVHDNHNAALGAKKAANDARRHFMDLMATVGKLPTDLELFQQEAALQRVADEMVQIMQSVERGETSAKDAVAAFWRMTGRDADPTELPR